VKTGSYVRIGQLIGNVGSTGLSTGPHLHFAMEKAGTYVNPLTEKLGENHPVSPRMRALFDDIKDRYQTALSKLPDMGTHYGTETVSADSRKPAISKFADMYHVTLGHPAKSRSHRGSRLTGGPADGVVHSVGAATSADGAL
jgi:hypothetical protein